jgi:hypothetical protein
VGLGAEDGRDGDAEGGVGQLMEMTLDQIALMLAQQSKGVPKEKRASFQEVMRLLRTPVGGLKTRKDK